MRGAIQTQHPMVGRGGASGTVDDAAVIVLLARHAQLRALLDRVEDTADTLPDSPPADACDRLCRELAEAVALLAVAQDRFFADIFSIDEAPPAARAVVDRVRCWRSADTLHLRDTIVALRQFAGDSGDDERLPADTLGYMLRCSFDGWRRLLDHAELAIVAFAGARLSLTARAMLGVGADRDPTGATRRPSQ